MSVKVFPHYRIIAIVWVFFGLSRVLDQTVVAQQKTSGIHENLDKLQASRQKIQTYQVKLRGMHIEPGSKASTGQTIKYIHQKQLEIVADRVKDRYLIVAQTEPALPGLAYRGDLGDSPSNVLFIDRQIAWYFHRDRLQTEQEAEYVPYPDPLTLGVGFCVENSRFVRFEQAIKNLKTWRDLNFEQDGSIHLFRNPIFRKPKLSSTHIAFDTARDSVVSSIGHRYGQDDSEVVLGEVETVQMDGHWLPQRVTYLCNSNFFTWELDWISVNQPLRENIFEESQLGELVASQYSELPMLESQAPSVQLCQLLFAKNVRTRLGIAADQFQRLSDKLEKLWDHAPTAQEFERSSVAERFVVMQRVEKAAATIDADVWELLIQLLSASDRQALMGAHLQYFGPGSMLNTRIAGQLALTQKQREAIVELLQHQQAAHQSLCLRSHGSSAPGQKAVPALTHAQLLVELEKLLDEPQKMELKAMLTEGSQLGSFPPRRSLGW